MSAVPAFDGYVAAIEAFERQPCREHTLLACDRLESCAAGEPVVAGV